MQYVNNNPTNKNKSSQSLQSFFLFNFLYSYIFDVLSLISLLQELKLLRKLLHHT